MVLKQIYDDNKFTGIRLPTTCKPTTYSLTLEPDLKAFTFKGQLGIDVEVTEALDQIILNAVALNFQSASYVADGETFEVSRVILNTQTETAILTFDKPLKAGTGKINIVFDGTLNDKLKGFYRSRYQLNGEERYAAVTQFAPTDARRAFPCWDEPAAKARFDITLVVDPERIALSNMNAIEESTNADGKRVVKFATTPIMSTYLVACVVGEFDQIERLCKDRPVRVFTEPGKIELGEFALDVAIKSLSFYEQYFGLLYPLPKMDLIAIADFAFGAMENWGLVTYREARLLVDPKNTSTQAKQQIALVVAHEIAHQWFGNLVTMEWWTHLWLNEGFASFMEFLCVDHIFPEYDIWTQFVTDRYARALELDALHNSHPIEVPIDHPSEIDTIFDDISYNKGASVIRMLHNYISDECFRSGMKAYLTKFAYSNASTEQLWEALEAASSKPVTKVMTHWTKQKGFPWLSVTCKTTEGTSIFVTVNQNKFASDGKISPEERNLTWMIPLAIATGACPSKTVKELLLEKATDEIKLENVGDNWIKFNPGTIGLYRTAYTREMINKYLPAISKKTLPPLDRFGIQNDYFALCQAGAVSTVELLKLLNAFSSENNYTVWSSIDNCLGQLNILFSHTDYQDLFHSYARKLYDDIFQKLTWTPASNENHTDALSRALVIGSLISFDDQGVIAEAKKRFSDHISKTSLIPADLKSAVYRAVAAYGDDEMFESIFKIYRESNLHEEKNRAATALGYSKDEGRIKRVIDFAMSDEVRNQDKVSVIISVAMTTKGRDAAWELITSRAEDLKERYAGGMLMNRLIKLSTGNFASEEKALEVLKFFTDNKFPGTERVVQQSVETIRLNAGWLNRDSSTTKSFLLSSRIS